MNSAKSITVPISPVFISINKASGRMIVQLESEPLNLDKNLPKFIKDSQSFEHVLTCIDSLERCKGVPGSYSTVLNRLGKCFTSLII